jgi:hypothetical protein
MNSRKKGTRSEVNITSTMIWGEIATKQSQVTNESYLSPRTFIALQKYSQSISIQATHRHIEIILFFQSNIATEIFPVQRNGFSSLKCTWYVDAEKSTDRLFYCVTNSQSETTELPGKITEASITIPETLFQQLEDQDHHLPDQVYSILVAMYSSNKLFPIDEARAGKEDVTTAVVGAKLGERQKFITVNQKI